MKKLSVIIVSLLVCCANIFSSSAALPENEIMPLWENADTVVNDIRFNTSDGDYVYVVVDCKSGTTSLTVAAKLYKQTATGGWSLVKSKTGTSSTSSVSFEVPFEAVNGTYYKSVLSITSYRGGVRYSDSHTAYATY